MLSDHERETLDRIQRELVIEDPRFTEAFDRGARRLAVCPRHMVPIQLKNFRPVGMAMRKLVKEKNASSTAPVAYMWCAHTADDRPAIAIVAQIIVL